VPNLPSREAPPAIPADANVRAPNDVLRDPRLREAKAVDATGEEALELLETVRLALPMVPGRAAAEAPPVRGPSS
jgi:hypothetical protein